MSMPSQKLQGSVGNAISQGEQQHVSLLVKTAAHLGISSSSFSQITAAARRTGSGWTGPPTGRSKSGGKPQRITILYFIFYLKITIANIYY
jgi:hypothetical protein